MLCPNCGRSVDERRRHCPECGKELNTGQVEQFTGPNSPRFYALEKVKSRLGRKAQVGGGIVLLMGLLFLVMRVPPGASGPVLHKMAWVFITIGIFLNLVGTFWRWFYLD